MIFAQPIENGMINRSIVNFLPNISITKPIIRHEIIAPTVAIDPIQDHCSLFTGNPYTLYFTIALSAGELQPNTQPAANAPVVANTEN